MDILGPLPHFYGFRYILAMVDGWTRFCHLRPLKTTASDKLEKFFSENGLWGVVKIDGKCLSMKGVDKQLVEMLGVGVINLIIAHVSALKFLDFLVYRWKTLGYHPYSPCRRLNWFSGGFHKALASVGSRN